jgi:rod shape determining protein RodA
MTIGIMPITGLPLPFISYGGSAAFADMIAIGILQSVHRKRTGLAAAFSTNTPSAR